MVNIFILFSKITMISIYSTSWTCYTGLYIREAQFGLFC